MRGKINGNININTSNSLRNKPKHHKRNGHKGSGHKSSGHRGVGRRKGAKFGHKAVGMKNKRAVGGNRKTSHDSPNINSIENSRNDHSFYRHGGHNITQSFGISTASNSNSNSNSDINTDSDYNDKIERRRRNNKTKMIENKDNVNIHHGIDDDDDNDEEDNIDGRVVDDTLDIEAILANGNDETDSDGGDSDGGINHIYGNHYNSYNSDIINRHKNINNTNNTNNTGNNKDNDNESKVDKYGKENNLTFRSNETDSFYGDNVATTRSTAVGTTIENIASCEVDIDNIDNNSGTDFDATKVLQLIDSSLMVAVNKNDNNKNDNNKHRNRNRNNENKNQSQNTNVKNIQRSLTGHTAYNRNDRTNVNGQSLRVGQNKNKNEKTHIRQNGSV